MKYIEYEKMNSKIRFSIVTITFNAEECIARTIESVLNQNYSNIEYIFMDGGSKDSTNKIIGFYEPKLKKKGISVIHCSEPDKGISDAFNKGIKCATGEIIVILNADDELLSGALNIIDNEFSEDVDILYGNAVWDDVENNIKKIKRAGRKLPELLYRMILIHPATFIKKSAYDKNGVFDIHYKFCMDKELLYRMYKAGVKFKFVDKELALMKSGGVSDKNTVKVIKEGEKMAVHYGANPLKAFCNATVKIWKCKLIKTYKKSLMINKAKYN